MLPIALWEDRGNEGRCRDVRGRGVTAEFHDNSHRSRIPLKPSYATCSKARIGLGPNMTDDGQILIHVGRMYPPCYR